MERIKQEGCSEYLEAKCLLNAYSILHVTSPIVQVNPEEREGLLEDNDDDDTPASRPVPQTEATLLDIGGGNGSGLNVAGTALCL
jgi:hypothetical protein